MPPRPATPPLIQTPAALDAALATLRAVPSLAFDLEFDANLRGYGLSLGLIQLATPDGEAILIDPLAGLDLRPLWDVMEDRGILKLVHSPGEDLRLLHGLGVFPALLFDTEIPARLLNYERSSLSAMLEAKLGVELSGAQQRSNWMARPLSRAQLDYAAADALHLHDLKAALDAECADRGIGWVVESEQAALSAWRCDTTPRTDFLKSADLRHLSPHAQHILQTLMRHRDETARAENVPPFRIADEGWLRALATDPAAPAVVRPDAASTRKWVATFKDVRQEAADEADRLELSTALPPRVRPTREERQAQARADRDKHQLFAPIQARLAEEWGTFAARYLLSNGQVGDILRGETTLRGSGREARREILHRIAADLGLSLEAYD